MNPLTKEFQFADYQLNKTIEDIVRRINTKIDSISPLYFNMLTLTPSSIGQGTWIRGVDSSRLYCGYFYNSSGVNLDNFSIKFYVPAGTYTLQFNANKNTNKGIVDVDIDGVEKGSFDLYAATLNALNIAEITGLVLNSAEHTLRFRIDGKNASSTGYYFTASGIVFSKTA